MIWLKTCPRCKSGDMYLDEDDSKHCMQCGHVHYSRDSAVVAFELARFLGGSAVEREALSARAGA